MREQFLQLPRWQRSTRDQQAYRPFGLHSACLPTAARPIVRYSSLHRHLRRGECLQRQFERMRCLRLCFCLPGIFHFVRPSRWWRYRQWKYCRHRFWCWWKRWRSRESLLCRCVCVSARNYVGILLALLCLHFIFESAHAHRGDNFRGLSYCYTCRLSCCA